MLITVLQARTNLIAGKDSKREDKIGKERIKAQFCLSNWSEANRRKKNTTQIQLSSYSRQINKSVKCNYL